MKMNHMLRTIVLSTVFTLLAVFLMTPVASAHIAAPAYGAATATSQVPDASNVDIITVNHRSEYSEGTVGCGYQSGQPCIQITNRTNKTQVVINGAPIATLQPGQSVGIIPVGPGTYPFTLDANDQAMLTMIVS